MHSDRSHCLGYWVQNKRWQQKCLLLDARWLTGRWHTEQGPRLVRVLINPPPYFWAVPLECLELSQYPGVSRSSKSGSHGNEWEESDHPKDHLCTVWPLTWPHHTPCSLHPWVLGAFLFPWLWGQGWRWELSESSEGAHSIGAGRLLSDTARPPSLCPSSKMGETEGEGAPRYIKLFTSDVSEQKFGHHSLQFLTQQWGLSVAFIFVPGTVFHKLDYIIYWRKLCEIGVIIPLDRWENWVARKWGYLAHETSKWCVNTSSGGQYTAEPGLRQSLTPVAWSGQNRQWNLKATSEHSGLLDSMAVVIIIFSKFQMQSWSYLPL